MSAELQHPDNPTAYPLRWPAGKPRTKSRRNGQFKHNGSWITVDAALRRVEAECGRLNALYPLVSTNIPRRMDGGMRGGANPDGGDPGAVLYFHLKGVPMTMACDTYTTVADNIAAIAAHLDATRAIERYGVATAAEVLQAFTALPPPAQAKPKRPWWEVLGVVRGSVDADDVEALFRARMKKAHPDQGGSVETAQELALARAEAMAEIRS